MNYLMVLQWIVAVCLVIIIGLPLLTGIVAVLRLILGVKTLTPAQRELCMYHSVPELLRPHVRRYKSNQYNNRGEEEA